MDIEDYIKRMEQDIKELKDDMKQVLAFVAVSKDRASRKTMIYSGLISIVVTVVGAFLKEYV